MLFHEVTKYAGYMYVSELFQDQSISDITPMTVIVRSKGALWKNHILVSIVFQARSSKSQARGDYMMICLRRSSMKRQDMDTPV
jgi:hypothetical protein